MVKTMQRRKAPEIKPTECLMLPLGADLAPVGIGGVGIVGLEARPKDAEYLARKPYELRDSTGAKAMQIGGQNPPRVCMADLCEKLNRKGGQ